MTREERATVLVATPCSRRLIVGSADLLYRLNVFPIHIPPLRKRREDVRFWSNTSFNDLPQKMAKRIRRIEKRTMELCERYPWPGNIRELQNIVERSVILCGDDTFSIDEGLAESDAITTGSGRCLTQRSAGSGKGPD